MRHKRTGLRNKPPSDLPVTGSVWFSKKYEKLFILKEIRAVSKHMGSLTYNIVCAGNGLICVTPADKFSDHFIRPTKEQLGHYFLSQVKL